MTTTPLAPAINLAKRKKTSLLDRFLRWSLTIGRLLIIITEVIAFSSFLYRFSLDRQLIDLHDSIKQKQTIVNLLKNSEETYRNLQTRLGAASQFINQEKETTQLFKDVTSFAPEGFTFNNIVISNTNLKIDASVRSVNELSRYITKLKAYPSIQSLSLDSINNRTSSSVIEVTITAIVKRKT